MKKGLFFILLIFSPLTYAQYYFNSAMHGEVSFEYGQGRNSINEINFVVDCDQSHCNLKQYSKVLFTDFLKALNQGQIYRYEVRMDIGPTCLPFEPCIKPRRQKKTRVYIRDFMREFARSVASELGTKTVDQIIADNIDDKGQINGVLFTVIHTESGRPIAMCVISDDTCTIIDDVKFTNNGVEIHNFDLSELTDRIMRNRLEEFLFDIYVRCIPAYTGPAGDTRLQYVCW